MLLALLLALFAALLVGGCGGGGDVGGGGNSEPGVAPVQLSYEIVATYPHDPTWFTQGLEYFEGTVYESTGLVGESFLWALDLAELERLASTGASGASDNAGTSTAVAGATSSAIKAEARFADEFGEGIARVDDLLYWLTWKTGEVATFQITGQTPGQITSFEPGARFSYEGEGWGLCYNGDQLVKSNGTEKLTLHTTDDFAVAGEIVVSEIVVDKIAVADSHASDLEVFPVGQLNELECVDGLVWANVWQTDRIVVIDPGRGGDDADGQARGEINAVGEMDAVGKVIAVADMSDLIRPHPADSDPEAVLNGIAYRPDSDTFLLTGKRWPQMFEVRFNTSAIPRGNG